MESGFMLGSTYAVLTSLCNTLYEARANQESTTHSATLHTVRGTIVQLLCSGAMHDPCTNNFTEPWKDPSQLVVLLQPRFFVPRA